MTNDGLTVQRICLLNSINTIIEFNRNVVCYRRCSGLCVPGHFCSQCTYGISTFAFQAKKKCISGIYYILYIIPL